MVGQIHGCDKPTHSDDGCSVSRSCCIDNQQVFPLSYLKDAWDALENLWQDFIYPDCLECIWKRVYHLHRSAFCRSHTLSPEHARHSDWWWHWQVAHFSISLTASRQTRCSCNSRIWMDSIKQQRKAPTPTPSHTVFTVHRLFIYLFIIFVLGQNSGKQDRLKVILLSLEEVINAKSELHSSVENEIIHELFHPRCGDLCLVRLHYPVFHGPFDTPLLDVLCSCGIQIFI